MDTSMKGAFKSLLRTGGCGTCSHKKVSDCGATKNPTGRHNWMVHQIKWGAETDVDGFVFEPVAPNTYSFIPACPEFSLLEELVELTPLEAKQFVDNTPAQLGTELHRIEADELEKEFVDLGAKIERRQT